MSRPPVDIVVPFRGRRRELEELRARLERLRLGTDDSLVVVDNSPGGGDDAWSHEDSRVPVIAAPDRAAPGFARNRGAALGSAPWIVFLDADVIPPPDLLELYFDPPPAERTGLMAGGIRDEPVPADGPPVPRHSYISQGMSQDNTFGYGSWGFPQTANVACRRAAFEEVGGFRDDVRAGEDADLTYRLAESGWEVERREHAAVLHRSRETVLGYLRQKAIHGGGAGWVARQWPGTFPARRRPGLVWWAVRTSVKGSLSAARSRDRDKALRSVLEPLAQVAFELGRSLPNERPLRRRPGRRGERR